MLIPDSLSSRLWVQLKVVKIGAFEGPSLTYVYNFNPRIELVIECTEWKVLCGTYHSAHNEIEKGLA